MSTGKKSDRALVCKSSSVIFKPMSQQVRKVLFKSFYASFVLRRMFRLKKNIFAEKFGEKRNILLPKLILFCAKIGSLNIVLKEKRRFFPVEN
jgi:hypothetical protein